MPPLLLLSKLRLPTRGELALAGACAVVLLLASWQRRGEKIAALEAQLAAKPAVDERREVKEEKGPTVTKRRYAPPPPAAAGCPDPQPVLLEETVEEGPSRREELLAREETPVAPARTPAKPRWALLTLDPGQSFRPRRLQGGISFLEDARVTPMVGASYDWRYGAAGLEVGGRW